MKSRKLLFIINIFCVLLLTGCYQTSALSKNSSTDIFVKPLTLKISLFETAYEIYNIKLENPSYSKDLYYEYKYLDHYNWLESVSSDIDDNMMNSLENIFSDYSDSTYINTVIHLDDNSSFDDIIDYVLTSNKLSISKALEKDLLYFFEYFYDNHFESYFYSHKYKYDKQASIVNEKLNNNEVNLSNFIDPISGKKLDEEYKFIVYYSLSPLYYNSFESNNEIITTISFDTHLMDIVSFNFYRYSKILFEPLKINSEFINICDALKENKSFLSLYNEKYSDYYDYYDWCLENLISGFSKYLDYRYFGSTYEGVSYIYDLDFYNYLKNNHITLDESYLEKISCEFYKSIVPPPK